MGFRRIPRRKGKTMKQKIQVWYQRDEVFGRMGYSAFPNAADLSATHIHVKNIEATSRSDAFMQMQAERWSPNGEARELIECLGLSHTSMCVGDIIREETGRTFMCKPIGWQLVAMTTEPQAKYVASPYSYDRD